MASSQGDEKLIQLLLDQNADINDAQGILYGTPLEEASFEGHERVVQLLLAQGANVNTPCRRRAVGGNALIAAILKGHNKVVQMLLDSGADINAEDGRSHFRRRHLKTMKK